MSEHEPALREPTWGDLDRKPDDARDTPRRREFDALCFRLSLGPDGADLIRHLRAMTKDRALGPGVSDAALRYLEGQRGLVNDIENAVERGRRYAEQAAAKLRALP